MCDHCATPFPSLAPPVDANRLWAMARSFETDMPGIPATETDWAIFAGRATGSIAFPALERMSLSRSAALQALEQRPVSPKPKFCCEAA